MSGGLDDADEVLEEVLLLLLDEAALDAEPGLRKVLADVVLDALRPKHSARFTSSLLQIGPARRYGSQES